MGWRNAITGGIVLIAIVQKQARNALYATRDGASPAAVAGAAMATTFGRRTLVPPI